MTDGILPKTWHVYGPVEPKHLDWWPPDSLVVPMNLGPDHLPESVKVAGRRVARRTVTVKDGQLDLAGFVGGNVGPDGTSGFFQDQGQTANVLIPFELEQDQEITFGFGADWWFAAFLDNYQLLSSLPGGNGNSPATSHDFKKTVKVARGRHLLAVRCVGGGCGCLLCVSAAPAAAPAMPAAPKTLEWVVTDLDIKRGRKLWGAPGGDFAGRRVVLEADIEYGRAGDRRLALEILRPKDQGKKVLPVMVWIHGGGWEMGSKESGRALFYSHFAASGQYICVLVGYRFTTEAIWPAQIHDCKAALRWIRANAAKYGMDAERIGIMGESAGGHLVSLLGVSGDVKELEGANGNPGFSTTVRCVADFTGPANFYQDNFAQSDFNATDRHMQCYRFIALLLGGAPAEKREAARAAAPITWLTKDAPPFLVVQGLADKAVPPTQGINFAAALKKAGVPVTFLPVKGAGHNDLWTLPVGRRLHAFLDKNLRG